MEPNPATKPDCNMGHSAGLPTILVGAFLARARIAIFGLAGRRDRGSLTPDAKVWRET